MGSLFPILFFTYKKKNRWRLQNGLHPSYAFTKDFFVESRFYLSRSYASVKESYNFINDYLSSSSKNGLSCDWDNLKVEFIKSDRNANERNVDALILKYLTSNRLWNEGKDFIKHTDNNGEKLNLGAVGKSLKFYYYYGLNNKLSNQEVCYIKETHKELIKKYGVLDATTSESCISALSLTTDWKKGLELAEKMKVISTPTKLVHSCLASAAFRNKDPEVGWNILCDMAEIFQSPNDSTLNQWFEYCITNKDNKTDMSSNIERMFDYCAENHINLGISVVKQLIEIFSNCFQLDGKLVNIKNGQCPSCKSSLAEILITDTEYDDLYKAFYSRVLVGENIFLKSTPTEQKNFLKYLEKHAPFDVVIDGLNVAYSIPKNTKLSLIVSVVEKFSSENKKVLVLGRKHMLNWPKHEMKYIQNNANLFLTEDLSYDDPFLILATLKSPHSKFLSRDAMRSHKFLLKEERLRRIFKRWQQKNQMSLIFVTKTGRPIIREPSKYFQVAHKNKYGWHIPYNLIDDQINPDSFEFHENWLCLHPGRKQK